jgi:acetyl-CoA C-acetyltransferase
LADAGLAREDVDGYFCSGDAPGPGPASMAEYMNLKLRHMDSTEIGGASYVALAAHAAEAIALGKCDVALVTLAGRPRSDGMATGTAPRARSEPAGSSLGSALRHHYRQRLCDVRYAPYV